MRAPAEFTSKATDVLAADGGEGAPQERFLDKGDAPLLFATIANATASACLTLAPPVILNPGGKVSSLHE
jgi:hypothetical protein